LLWFFRATYGEEGREDRGHRDQSGTGEAFEDGVATDFSDFERLGKGGEHADTVP
jgi:hypothetical protein